VTAVETPLVEVPLVEVRGISKQFPGVRALDQVSLHVGPAEVLALIGENGAGKSTLLKILAGVQPPDEGEVLVAGRAVRFRGVEDALEAGIALIHQELNLADNVRVRLHLRNCPCCGNFVKQLELMRKAMRQLGAGPR
jgi:ribose transport system ATP-binding protein